MREIKQSGIDWIGEIPKEWQLKRLKNFGWARSGIASLKPEDFGYGFPFLNYKNVYKNIKIDVNAEELINSTEEDRLKYSVKKGDAFFTGSSETVEELGLSSVALEDWKNAVFNGFTIRVRPYGKEIDINYSKYLFRSEVCRGYLSANDNSITRANLSQQRLLCMPIVVPTLLEQTVIASYLDDKCDNIDTLVETEEKIIAELKEYKKSIIQKTTTKGIEKIKLKDSGVEWLKEVPIHWEVLPTKQVMRKSKDICETYNGENIISLTIGGVIKRDLDNPKGKMPTTFDGYQKVYKGNLLLCLFDIDVTPRCVGLICDNGLTSPAYSQFVLNKKAHAPYYNYYLTAIDNDKIYLHLSKNLRSTISEDDFGLIPIVLPPMDEQKAIAKYLDKKTSEVDELIAIKQQKIAELKKYKKSLIYECVTGKKEVV